MSKQTPGDTTSREIAELLLERISRLSRQFRNVDLPAGMTPERVNALSAIDHSGSISITDLAIRELVRPATMSRMVSALVDEDLVRRRGNKADARGVLVSVTPKGRRAYQRAQQKYVEQLERAVSTLSAEQRSEMQELVDVLEHLTAALSESSRSDRATERFM